MDANHAPVTLSNIPAGFNEILSLVISYLTRVTFAGANISYISSDTRGTHLDNRYVNWSKVIIFYSLLVSTRLYFPFINLRSGDHEWAKTSLTICLVIFAGEVWHCNERSLRTAAAIVHKHVGQCPIQLQGVSALGWAEVCDACGWVGAE